MLDLPIQVLERIQSVPVLLRVLQVHPKLCTRVLETCRGLFWGPLRDTLITVGSMQLCHDVHTRQGRLASRHRPFMKTFYTRVLVEPDTQQQNVPPRKNTPLKFASSVLECINERVLPHVMDVLEKDHRLMREHDHAVYAFSCKSATERGGNIHASNDDTQNKHVRKCIQSTPHACTITTQRMTMCSPHRGLPHTESRCAQYVYHITPDHIQETRIQYGGYGCHWDRSHHELMDTMAGLHSVPYLQEHYGWLLAVMTRFNQFAVSMLDSIDSDIDDNRLSQYDTNRVKALCHQKMKTIVDKTLKQDPP